MSRLRALALLVALALPAPALAQLLHHQLEVRLEPARQSLSVSDSITLPENSGGTLTFYLHSGRDPRASTGGAEARLEKLEDDGFYARYRLSLPASSRRFQLSYGGRLHHELGSTTVEQSRGFRDSPGLIDQRGSFLSASSLWYPQFDRYRYQTFELDVAMPAGWRSVSQGNRLQREQTTDGVRERWRDSTPQQEIYLIAAAFTEYSRPAETPTQKLDMQVFLRSAD